MRTGTQCRSTARTSKSAIRRRAPATARAQTTPRAAATPRRTTRPATAAELSRLGAGLRERRQAWPARLERRLWGARCGRLGRLGLLVGAEDRGLGLAGKQPYELVRLDRLATEQDLGRGVQVRAVCAEDVAGDLVRLLDDAADLGIDLASDVVRVV